MKINGSMDKVALLFILGLGSGCVASFKAEEGGGGGGSGSDSTDYGDPPGSLWLDELIEPDMASIWNGMVPLDDDGFVFSTMVIENNNIPAQLSIRHFDWDLNIRPIEKDGQEANFIVVSEVSDIAQGDFITDHAILRAGDSLYLAYTGNFVNRLNILKTDLNGNREEFVTLFEDAPFPANDMMMATDGEKICIRIGSDGPKKYVHCRSLDLQDVVLDKEITTPTFTGNLGSAVFSNNEFRCFAGGNNQRDVMMTRYDRDWTPLEPFEVQVVATENDEWNWAASGSTYIPEYDMWAVAYTNMPSNGAADFDSRGRLDLFDSDFNLIDRGFYGELATHRPHLFWQYPYLFLSYDAGPVVIRRYLLQE